MLSHAAFAVALITLTGFVLLAIELGVARLRMIVLGEVPRLGEAPSPAWLRLSRRRRDAPQEAARSEAPFVSVLVAARDEAPHIAAAMQSLLELDYPSYEVVAVDDRSSDATGAILDELAAGSDGKLRVVHIRSLPDGWLGKNNALQQAALSARGEFLLFTDADVVFEPTSLSRAIRYMLDRGVDHLAASPEIAMPTIPLTIVLSFFAYSFAVFTRPWKASNPRSRSHIGIGAFNLVRTEAYRRAGMHERIAMRPDDDLRLGRILKESGARQDFIVAGPLVRVAWYRSTGEFIRGLQKNAFSAFNYSTPLAFAAILFSALVHLWPSAALLLTSGATRAMNAAIVLIQVVILGGVIRNAGRNATLGFGYPFGATIFIYTVLFATINTLARGGIEWRGTRYSLAQLRGSK